MPPAKSDFFVKWISKTIISIFIDSFIRDILLSSFIFIPLVKKAQVSNLKKIYLKNNYDLLIEPIHVILMKNHIGPFHLNWNAHLVSFWIEMYLHMIKCVLKYARKRCKNPSTWFMDIPYASLWIGKVACLNLPIFLFCCIQL